MSAATRAVAALLRMTAATAVLAGVLAACSSGSSRPVSLSDAVLRHVQAAQEDDGGTYRPPTDDARQDLVRAVLLTAQHRVEEAEPLLERHGYVVRRAGEGAEVRLIEPERVPDDRGWGLYAVLPGGRPMAVEVPHPRADLETERLGGLLAERVRAQHLLLAGARRDRADGRADVAHEPSSVFAAVHTALAEQGLPAVQLHGFAAESSPGNDVVVSPGAAPLSGLVRQVAAELDRARFRTCRVWVRECGQLEGRTNAQSAASAAADAPFVHLEVSREVRDDPARRELLLAAVARAVDARVALPPASPP